MYQELYKKQDSCCRHLKLRLIFFLKFFITSLKYYIIDLSFYSKYLICVYKVLRRSGEMKTVEQIAGILPFGQTVLHGAEGVYDYSKQRSVQVYNSTKSIIVERKKEYKMFRKNVQSTFNSIAQETVNQVLGRLQNFIGVQANEKNLLDLKNAHVRIKAIIQTLYRQYLLKSRFVNNQYVRNLAKLGKNYSTQYLTPMYIHLKATMIVSKELFIQFVQFLLREVKLTYQTSKDSVVMFVGGQFNQENLKKKVIEGIDNFKNLTIRVVNKGLEIKVDRESLIENYDQFAVKLLEIVHQMKTKSQQNIGEIKKKSKDLYKEVISRIRAKQLQIKVNLKLQSAPKTQTESQSEYDC